MKPTVYDYRSTAEFVKNPNPPMPDLHPNPLSDADVTAIAEALRQARKHREHPGQRLPLPRSGARGCGQPRTSACRP